MLLRPDSSAHIENLSYVEHGVPYLYVTVAKLDIAKSIEEQAAAYAIRFLQILRENPNMDMKTPPFPVVFDP